jgi:iron complex outermembrane receptor protein
VGLLALLSSAAAMTPTAAIAQDAAANAVADSLVPLRIISAEALETVACSPRLLTALAQVVPALVEQAFGSGLAGHTLQATLRGLSPNDVLVLVNGKRRHLTANVGAHPGGGPHQPDAGVDFDFIALDAIERIDILTDGAAARYGSDAIAGVINIVLKKRSSGLAIGGIYGGHFEGGSTADASGNAGFAPTDGGTVNATAEVRHEGDTPRDGDSPRGAIDPGGTPYELQIFALNAGFDVGNGGQLYAFGTYGTKTDATAYASPGGVAAAASARETDYSLTGGLKGAAAQWNWDLSTTYGGDKPEIDPLSGMDLQVTQWTSTLAVERDADCGLAGPLNIASGVEYRRDGLRLDGEVLERNDEAIYLDFAAKPLIVLRVDAAARYEHTSDAGSATVGQFAARYDLTPQFAVRATAANNFRAPTLAEQYYLTAANTSARAAPGAIANATTASSAATLPQERSVNYSVGLVWRPTPGLDASLSLYQIAITDRLVATSTNVTTGTAQFANGLDTRTHGAQLSIDFPWDYTFGHITWSFGAELNGTSITKAAVAPGALAGTSPYETAALSAVTTATPRDVIDLNALWVLDKASIDLMELVYGQATTGAIPLTNFDLGYQFTRRFKMDLGALDAFDRMPSANFPSFAPFGIHGGYGYVRAAFTF